MYEPKFILYYSVGLLYSVLLFSIYFHSFFFTFLDPPSELEYPPNLSNEKSPGNMNWRFRVPDDENISFIDGIYG